MFVWIIVLLQFVFGHAFNYEQPVAGSLWKERCKRNSYVLNDCNWCWCSEGHHYRCKARVCEEVDMFGHFKDAIQEINVGMEGHGSWRSKPTSCTPGVQYRRGSVHCICDEDGNWPNPVCRDLFRILHSVEVTESTEESTSQSCLPTKLYLVGCNVCLCPSTGLLNSSLCTNRTCTEDDPALAPKESSETRKSIKKSDASEYEVYAPCVRHQTYTIGCQKCKCLPHNRLLCDECGKSQTAPSENQIGSLCVGKIGQILQIICNVCKCDSIGYMYCTTRKCLPTINKQSLDLKKPPRFTGKLVEAPLEDLDCTPGTRYERDCNTCFCKIENGKKIFGCTVRPCKLSSFDDMLRDCKKDTTYEIDCLICHCQVINGEKYQSCKANSRCISTLVLKETKSQSLDSLHGYCEPLHVYENGCNTCKCLANGKVVKCTTRNCVARSSEPVSVDIVPLQQAENEPCPEGFSYKVGCNLCICLSNGNALCTTTDCSQQAQN